MHLGIHEKTEQCARVFVQDAAEQTSGGMTRAELLLVVLEGTVCENDIVNVPMVGGKKLPREIKGLVQKCKTCSFGTEMQEGDRGAVVVPGLDVESIELGAMTTVVRGTLG
jgi:hypothetical protein